MVCYKFLTYCITIAIPCQNNGLALINLFPVLASETARRVYNFSYFHFTVMKILFLCFLSLLERISAFKALPRMSNALYEIKKYCGYYTYSLSRSGTEVAFPWDNVSRGLLRHERVPCRNRRCPKKCTLVALIYNDTIANPKSADTHQLGKRTRASGKVT